MDYRLQIILGFRLQLLGLALIQVHWPMIGHGKKLDSPLNMETIKTIVSVACSKRARRDLTRIESGRTNSETVSLRPSHCTISQFGRVHTGPSGVV